MRNAVVESAGVDWITCTARQSADSDPLSLVARARIAEARNEGNTERQWRWNGYDGVTCGQVAFGRRADGAIVRLSGVYADANWRFALASARNVSRLDLQVTARPEHPIPTLASDGYKAALLAEKADGRPVTATLITRHPAGATLYLGSRQSERFARLYDKHAESGDERYAGCWRYELELKGEVALRMARRLERVLNWRQAVVNTVHLHFEMRGVEPVFPRDAPGFYERSHRELTDDEKSLHWLRTQVQPTVRRLVDNGHGPPCTECVGIESLDNPFR